VIGGVRKLALVVARLVDDPEAYKGKTNTHIENDIQEEAPTIPHVATIEKVTVLDIKQTKTP